MRVGTLVMATVGLLVTGVLVAAPASATTYLWEFDHRPASLPAAADPAQTLVTASADIRVASTATLDAAIALEAEPTPATESVIRLALGRTTDTGCRETWSIEFSSLDPTGPASRSGATITVRAGDLEYQDHFERCGSVSVLSADGSRTVLDRLEEPGESKQVVDDTGGRATVLAVRNHRVVPGRWSTFWVLVGYDGDDARGLSALDDHRDEVDVKGELATLLTWGARTWMPVRIRLHGNRAQKVSLHIRPDVDGWSDSTPKEIWIRPKR